MPVIGVLALQGDVPEHLRALEAAGATAVPVRRPEELHRLDGLVIPGGESTTLWRLSVAFEVLNEPQICGRSQKSLELGLPLLQGQPAQIRTVQFQQVEREEERFPVVGAGMQALEVCKPRGAADNDLAVNDDRARAQGSQGRGDARE